MKRPHSPPPGGSLFRIEPRAIIPLPRPIRPHLIKADDVILVDPSPLSPEAEAVETELSRLLNYLNTAYLPAPLKASFESGARRLFEDKVHGLIMDGEFAVISELVRKGSQAVALLKHGFLDGFWEGILLKKPRALEDHRKIFGKNKRLTMPALKQHHQDSQPDLLLLHPLDVIIGKHHILHREINKRVEEEITEAIQAMELLRKMRLDDRAFYPYRLTRETITRRLTVGKRVGTELTTKKVSRKFTNPLKHLERPITEKLNQHREDFFLMTREIRKKLKACLAFMELYREKDIPDSLRKFRKITLKIARTKYTQVTIQKAWTLFDEAFLTTWIAEANQIIQQLEKEDEQHLLAGVAVADFGCIDRQIRKMLNQMQSSVKEGLTLDPQLINSLITLGKRAIKANPASGLKLLSIIYYRIAEYAILRKYSQDNPHLRIFKKVPSFLDSETYHDIAMKYTLDALSCVEASMKLEPHFTIVAHNEISDHAVSDPLTISDNISTPEQMKALYISRLKADEDIPNESIHDAISSGKAMALTIINTNDSSKAMAMRNSR